MAQFPNLQSTFQTQGTRCTLEQWSCIRLALWSWAGQGDTRAWCAPLPLQILRQELQSTEDSGFLQEQVQSMLTEGTRDKDTISRLLR